MARKSSAQKFRFPAAERRNWGYWDGVNARERGRLPEWSRLHSGGHHPFDQPYGEAFWLGWDGEGHPNVKQ